MTVYFLFRNGSGIYVILSLNVCFLTSVNNTNIFLSFLANFSYFRIFWNVSRMTICNTSCFVDSFLYNADSGLWFQHGFYHLHVPLYNVSLCKDKVSENSSFVSECRALGLGFHLVNGAVRYFATFNWPFAAGRRWLCLFLLLGECFTKYPHRRLQSS